MSIVPKGIQRTAEMMDHVKDERVCYLDHSGPNHNGSKSGLIPIALVIAAVYNTYKWHRHKMR